jgi:hypothetical protein
MCVFAMYFVASFLMTKKLYSEVSVIIDMLNVIYFKDVCLENIFIYLKENEIRNYSMLIPENKNVGSSAFITKCLLYEQKYRDLRK